MRALVILPLVLGVAVSCGARNAILESEITLPRTSTVAGAATIFVLSQIRPAEGHDFDREWGGPNLASLRLEDAPRIDHISVEGDEGTDQVHVKVRFCRSDDCTAVEDANAAEVWYQLGEPFYRGKRTRWETVIDRVPFVLRPSQPIVIDRCQIQGCVDGPSSTYCRSDGSHLCED